MSELIKNIVGSLLGIKVRKYRTLESKNNQGTIHNLETRGNNSPIIIAPSVESSPLELSPQAQSILTQIINNGGNRILVIDPLNEIRHYPELGGEAIKLELSDKLNMKQDIATLEACQFLIHHFDDDTNGVRHFWITAKGRLFRKQDK